MKAKNFFAVGLLVAAGAAWGDEKPVEWEDPSVNSVGRLPARTYSMPLASEQAALTDALEPETPWKKSLNGTWKLSWTGDPALRVRDFWKTDFDDSGWFDIAVPSCVELSGFGSPGYTNVRYPHKMAWPKILDRKSGKPDYNPVSSYRTRFTVPESWQGRRIILRFDGVCSCYYVWVNGQKVGYAEDARLPSEFDITEFVRDQGSGIGDRGGENVLAVEVYRWCDGSYLEDQDMTRYSGIIRDVTLWSMPKDGLWDFSVKTKLDGTVEVDCPGATWKLYDAAFKEVATPVADVRAWSAEDPYLYTLVVKKGDDIRMRRVGFKEQKIVDGVFRVNGQPVKFKGVNRHETDPERGCAITFESMLRDVTLMKQYNVNAVRTSHYPDHHLWYDLCDRYGIYVCAEANVEGHEPGYGDKGLGRFPEWDHSIVERNARHVTFYRNHPCVTLWSLGNETGHGDCFRHAIAAVKELDPSRPVHWERGNRDADVDSRMYPSVEWLELRGQLGDGKDPDVSGLNKWDQEAMADQTKGKCHFICEYAHAMGNAIGNFQEYWDTFYAHDSLCGGCIWDWVDQAIWKDGVLAYGGDFDEEPNDGPFNCNGVVDPLRRVTAKLVEVGHVHRNLVVTRKDGLVFELWNRFSFTRADAFRGTWQLRANGEVVKSGTFETPAVAPLARGTFEVPGLAEAIGSTFSGAELFVDFAFETTKGELWAPKGWVVARDQVAVRDLSAPVAEDGDGTGRGVDLCTVGVSPTGVASDISQDEKAITVLCGGTKAVFCRKSGTLCELVMGGKTILKDAAPGDVAGPRLTCGRAFVDNDAWIRDAGDWRNGELVGGFVDSGLTQLRYHVRPIVVTSNEVRIVTEVTGSKSAGFTHEATWRFGADGSVEVANKVTPRGTMPFALPRLGLSLRLDKSLERIAYYGRGPRENYVDRCTGSFLGVWRSTVDDQFEPYVRPQDNGYKCDVRWAEFTDETGAGVRFSASEPLFMQALHHSLEDLWLARHVPGQKRHCAPLVRRDEVCLNLDVRQLGLGGNSCGPRTMDKYVFPIEVTEWSLRMAPVVPPEADTRVPFADPFVLCHDGKYYAYGTSGADGIGVAVSDDLRTWRWWQGKGKDGYALHKRDSWGEKWFWAPEVYFRDGRFVMYYSADVHVCAAVADSPLGPFRQVRKEPLLPGYSAIDNTLVEDGGKVRMFFTGGPDGKPWAVYSVEMSADGLTAKPDTVRAVIHAEQAWEKHTGGCVNEGSFVVRVGDRFVLSYSGNDYQDHLYGLGIAMAKDLDGPWTKFAGNPVFQRGFGLFGTGHHALFKDRAGKWRIVFHAHNSERKIHPRCMYIADIVFATGADGEPTMSVGGELITCRKSSAE